MNTHRPPDINSPDPAQGFDQRRIPTDPSQRGPVTTLAASGIDHSAAIGALTVAAVNGKISQDAADLIAAAVRAEAAGVRVTGEYRALLINVVTRICGEGR